MYGSNIVFEALVSVYTDNDRFFGTRLTKLSLKFVDETIEMNTLGYTYDINDLRTEIEMTDITLEQAELVLKASLKKAKDIGTKMNVAIVDVGGNLKTFARMDGSWLGSIDVSIKKARTSRLFNMPTGEIGNISQPGGELFNIEISNGGLITFPGGLPLTNRDNEIIGAIGVSGSSVANDLIVAEAGEMALSGHFLYAEKKM